ncbi:DDE-type integrase/transposase/recombinase [Streptomyces sp. NPDC007205]|uniref:DDE-type integrase/transposase/recombinase n=1 Tax=Streptomyces sp. NPDC007205 TaxID=3154316 RepID=UPI0033CC3D30
MRCSSRSTGCEYLWRAVDQDGQVLDILGQSHWDAKAAKWFMAKLTKKQCRVPQSAGHGQVPLLRAGSQRTDGLDGTRLPQGAGQPSGELTPGIRAPTTFSEI